MTRFMGTSPAASTERQEWPLEPSAIEGLTRPALEAYFSPLSLLGQKKTRFLKDIQMILAAAHYEMEQKQLQACKMVTYKQGTKIEEHFHHSPLRQLQILEQIYPQGRIMCWEKEGLPCHRHLLLALLHPESQEIPQCLLPTPSPKGEQS